MCLMVVTNQSYLHDGCPFFLILFGTMCVFKNISLDLLYKIRVPHFLCNDFICKSEAKLVHSYINLFRILYNVDLLRAELVSTPSSCWSFSLLNNVLCIAHADKVNLLMQGNKTTSLWNAGKFLLSPIPTLELAPVFPYLNTSKESTNRLLFCLFIFWDLSIWKRTIIMFVFLL